MKRKLISMALASAMVFSLVACGKKVTKQVESAPAGTEVATETVMESSKATVKIGLICLHDEQSTYDKNFMDAFTAACEATGVEYVIKTNIPESSECYEAALDLIDRGCNIIFGDSFGHEAFLLQAAREFPGVQFCHATGTMAHTENLPNFHNAFASIYEGRYLGGVVAGLKLNEMIEAGAIPADEAKVSYCSAFPYAECCSGYTAFYLGVKSVCPTVTMDVMFTGSWYDESLERENAVKLLSSGSKVISGHADSNGVALASKELEAFYIGYNGSFESVAPDNYIISCKINWQPYFEYIINCVTNGETIATDWTGTISTGSVELCELNTTTASIGTQEKIEEIKTGLINGTIHVFDTSTFTVNGETLTSYKADVDTDDAYTPDTEVIENGVFMESKFRSAPYFDITIDGINIISGD